jgi:hypothetical protein
MFSTQRLSFLSFHNVGLTALLGIGEMTDGECGFFVEIDSGSKHTYLFNKTTSPHGILDFIALHPPTLTAAT